MSAPVLYRRTLDGTLWASVDSRRGVAGEVWLPVSRFAETDEETAELRALLLAKFDGEKKLNGSTTLCMVFAARFLDGLDAGRAAQ